MQEPLFYETFYDALKAVVAACGGHKVVGAALWPEKTPEAASRTMSDALNPDRPEKLSPEQVLLILRMGRQKGMHAAMNYVARDTGYADPSPIEPEDERAKLQREFIEAQKAMQMLASRMERVGMLRAAA